jgi:hypothetical protein
MIELVPKLIPTGPALGVMATLTQYLSDPRADFSVRLANFFMYTFIHRGFLSECVYQLTRSALFFCSSIGGPAAGFSGRWPNCLCAVNFLSNKFC